MVRFATEPPCVKTPDGAFGVRLPDPPGVTAWIRPPGSTGRLRNGPGLRDRRSRRVRSQTPGGQPMVLGGDVVGRERVET